MFQIPIAFIIFNRPDTTKQVFEKIREIKPTKLYIISDGPRENNTDDEDKIKETREIIKKIDWECEIHKKYSEINLGCGINVSHGISWVFEKEEMAIILEDDCLPSISFFNYAKELLIKYKDDNRIMHIGGTNWHPEYKHEDDSSYFFSKDAHIWGWATWKRAWKNFDYEMKDYPLFINSKEFKTIISNRDERKYFRLRWDSFFKSNYKSNSKSNWDYQWYYAVLKNKGLCIWPKSNLVMNIGVNGTHTDKVYRKYHFVKTDNEFIINKHPINIEKNNNFDSYHYFHFNHSSLINKISNKLKKYSNLISK
jgi:hypothetical protein